MKAFTLLLWRNTLPPSVRKKISSVRWLKTILERIDLFIMYGSVSPSRIKNKTFGTELFVDVSEPRGTALLRSRAGGQPHLKRVWQRGVQALEPDLVVDVGANYGEFCFVPKYPSGTKVLAVEANPGLTPWLRKSHAVHPNRENIALVHGIAAEDAGKNQVIYIDPEWSGRSSILNRNAAKPVEVRTVSVDSEVHKLRSNGKILLFKIDVEGYEAAVLAGMQATLGAATTALGIIEFDCDLLRRTGSDPSEIMEGLLQQFGVFFFTDDYRLQRFQETAQAGWLHGNWRSDLVVIKNLPLSVLGLSSV